MSDGTTATRLANIIGAEMTIRLLRNEPEWAGRQQDLRKRNSRALGIALSKLSGSRLTCPFHVLFEMISTKLSTDSVDNFVDV
jgi:hypothetical protein